jgi:hypothetical protein
MGLRSLFVDFNSYFASVEQHEDPTLRGRAVGVAPVAAETTSLIAVSYEAKAFGVTLPGPANAIPLSVGVTLMRLVPRTQSSGSLFAPTQDTGRVDALVDRINAKFGYNKLYFGSMQPALEHDAAPMRIPFNRVPDTDSENEASHDPLWLQTMNRFKAITEGEHRRRERGNKN